MPTEFSRLATDYENELFNYSPELGLFWGRHDVAQDRFMDYSIEATQKWQNREDNFLNALNRMDDNKLRGSLDYYTYLLLKETLENKKESRICKEELWDINPAWGWHNKMTIIAEKQPVGSAEYRELALKRWRTFNTVVESQIINLKTGLKLGYTAPKPAIKGVLAQLKILVDSKIEESPFYDFARRDNDKDFKTEVAQIIETIINPSLRNYINYLETEYLPLARNEIGVSALPSGSQCYQSKIKQETTLDLTAKEIHEIGLRSIQKLSEEIAEIGSKKYGTKDIKVIFSKAKNDSINYFSSEQDILNYNLSALERVKLIVSNWFEEMPKSEGIIRSYPLHRAKTGASGEYHPPSEDGTEPGIFFINTYEPEKRNRIDMEATLFHELIPGHHFQVALNYENKSLLPLNKYLWNAGYGEGWALYVERLADEMGLYKDDISRLGMLSNESLRAARLVVDTGIHAMHWSRDQAIEYLTKYTALDEIIIEGEVDRYIMLPGQATSYLLGKFEIEQLRNLAKERLGKQFDIRQFHNQILNNGVVSLPLLRTIIDSWIGEVQKSNK
ncbi:MAG: DUF885 domain-containing protein [Tatlockia sp.]|nr:DUF885 domain-containing protein [Tatlockia sp.]